MRAGKLTIICPFFGDQPFWANRVADLGAGPKPVEKKKLSSDRLATAIAEATGTPSMQQRATQLGEAIRAEDGVASAIAFLDRMNLLKSRGQQSSARNDPHTFAAVLK